MTKHLFPEQAEQPIVIPENPFWEVFKRFGRDEAIAMVINVIGAAITQYVLLFVALSPTVRKLTLSLVGPVIEKVGFFPAHFKEAWDVYSTTPKNKREPLQHYIKHALKGSSTSLLEDILVHDPVYIILMYFGQVYSPATPAFLIAACSFIAAVFVVAALEVAAKELAYLKRKHALQKAGFGHESYYEARFFIRTDQKPDEILQQLAKEFSLPLRHTGVYHDRYDACSLPAYSGRTPKLRLRRRIIAEEKREVKTAQIVYTRSAELEKETSQFRYFPQQKDKFYAVLEKIPPSLETIQDKKVRAVLKAAVKGKKYHDITFTRTIVRDPETLLVAVDNIRGKDPFYILELKVRKNISFLKQAMRYAMLHFPVVQTTQGKHVLMK